MADQSGEDEERYDELLQLAKNLREVENQKVEDYRKVIQLSRKSINTKTKELGAKLISTYFKVFTGLSDLAFIAYSEIIAQVDGQVRVQAIRDLPLVCTPEFISSLDKVQEDKKLPLLRALAEISPHTTPQLAHEMLSSIVQLLKKYMPIEEVMESEYSDLEDIDLEDIDFGKMNFTYIECLLYVFHHFASKAPDATQSLCGYKVQASQLSEEDCSKLHKEFTNRLTTVVDLTGERMKILADKMRVHDINMKDQFLRMSDAVNRRKTKDEFRTCNNILAMTKELLAKKPSFIKDASFINLSWKELRKPLALPREEVKMVVSPPKRPDGFRSCLSYSCQQELENFGVCNPNAAEVNTLVGLSGCGLDLAEANNRKGLFVLNDLNEIAILVWQMKEEEFYDFVMNKLESRKDLMGDIRNQMYHILCWAYAACDLVSGMRRLRNWEDRFSSLCTWYLYTFCDPASIGKDIDTLPDHICYGSTIERALIYIQTHGIPKELLDEFDCNDLEPPSADEPGMYLGIKRVRRIKTIVEALVELQDHPIGADLVHFQGTMHRGKFVCYGPKREGASFKGYHSVLMLSVEQVGEEVVVFCKSSNGREVGDQGYIYVSLSTLYMPLCASDEHRNSIRSSSKPMHLLSNFIAVDMDEKEKDEEEEKEMKGKEDEEDDKEKEDEEEKKHGSPKSKKRRISSSISSQPALPLSTGGGRSSARETIGRVAHGALAKEILKQYAETEILAYVSQVHQVILPADLVDHRSLTLEQIESSIVRCPNPEYAEKMIAAIDAAKAKGNSVGGVVTCIIRNAPHGLGSPVFDKLEAELAKACMFLPAIEGFEFGSGFSGTLLTGLEHNNDENGRVRTRTNRSGGTQGGISNGEIINMRLAFKPTSTIGRKPTRDKQETEMIAPGRHDPCVVPQAVPMVEATVAGVLVEQLMVQKLTR